MNIGEIYHLSFFQELFARFLINLIVIFILIIPVYLKYGGRKIFAFAFFGMSIMIFFLSFFLKSLQIQLGFAIGLFAIFAIIRYRSTTISIREMVYLFITIGVAVLNALVSAELRLVTILFTNAAIIFSVWLLEKLLKLTHQQSIAIKYDNLELIKSQNYELLHKDLEEKTGLEIERIKVEQINYILQQAELKIYFKNDRGSA